MEKQEKRPAISGATQKRVYLAGPFFKKEEIGWIAYAESVLAERGFAFFSPMRHPVEGEPGTPAWARRAFEMDRAEIDRADLVVALYSGSEGDTGTAWECGYAAARGKPVVLVHVRREGDSNLMMHCGASTNIFLDELREYDFETMLAFEFEGKMF